MENECHTYSLSMLMSATNWPFYLYLQISASTCRSCSFYLLTGSFCVLKLQRRIIQLVQYMLNLQLNPKTYRAAEWAIDAIIVYTVLNLSRILYSSLKVIFLIGILGGGVQLGPLGNAATNRPIVGAPGDYDDGESGGMTIGRGNRSTRRKLAAVLLCPPQTPHAARTRTRAAAVGSQRPTAWATARPSLKVSLRWGYLMEVAKDISCTYEHEMQILSEK
jgi:hypothetical protein